MAIGRGLDALFSSNVVSQGTEVAEININLVEPRPEQPRKRFDREQLQTLADSIAQHGVIQPIIVVKSGEGYKIIAGERRWRAAKTAGLKTIPAIVRDYDELAAAEISLIENLQRENLNPIEEALGYKMLMEQFGLTQENVSAKVGKSRSAVANTLRLLSLDEEIKDMLEAGTISTGHARALLAISDRDTRMEAAKKAESGVLTVRQTESYTSAGKRAKKKEQKQEYPDVAEKLEKKLGTRVRITGEEKGRIEISFYSLEDLIRIVEILESK
ncbi:MAG: ParB/RepB/Spo0J family partition protein [Clostridia bacterium]|nr:ParB/RepB/Spo0J family partition protein [Clostridia bacterium]